MPALRHMLTLAIAFKLIAEIALFALAGQWLVGLAAGAARQRNPFYAVLQLLGKPWTGAARRLLPKAIPDRHMALLAFVLLLLLWCAASAAKVGIRLQIGRALWQ